MAMNFCRVKDVYQYLTTVAKNCCICTSKGGGGGHDAGLFAVANVALVIVHKYVSDLLGELLFGEKIGQI